YGTNRNGLRPPKRPRRSKGFGHFMADRVTPTDNPAESVAADSSSARRLFAGLENNRALRILGFVVVFASVLMSSISFLILSGTSQIEPSTGVWTIIWVVTGILVLLVIALVVTEAV